MVFGSIDSFLVLQTELLCGKSFIERNLLSGESSTRNTEYLDPHSSGQKFLKFITKDKTAKSNVVSLTVGSDSVTNFAASLQEARVAAEKGKCLGVIVNVAVEADDEESTVEKLKIIFGARSNSQVPILFASTMQDVQRFTVSTLLKLSKSGGFVVNCISSRVLRASTSLPDCIHSNSENIQTDVEPYEIYGDINHKLKAENIIVCYGTDFLRFKSVIHLFSSDHKIAILKLNRLESINIQDVFNRFESKILRILVPSSDGSFSKATSSSLCELEANNGVVGAQIFSINLKKFSQFSLNISFLNRVLLEFLSPTPKLDGFTYSAQDFSKDKSESERPGVENDLVKQILRYSVKPYAQRFEQILANDLNLETCSFAESNGDLERQTIFVGSVENLASVALPIINADLIVIEDPEVQFSDEDLSRDVLSHIGRDCCIIVNACWTEKEFLKTLPPSAVHVLNANKTRLIFVDMDILKKKTSSNDEVVLLDALLLWKSAGTNSGFNFNQALRHLNKLTGLSITEEFLQRSTFEAVFDETSGSEQWNSAQVELYSTIKNQFSLNSLKGSSVGDAKEYKATVQKLAKGMNVLMFDTAEEQNSLNFLFGKVVSSLMVKSLDASKSVVCLMSSNETSSEKIVSSVHNILSNQAIADAKLNLNVVILLPSSASAERAKRDIGLFCMHYGNCFVGSVFLQKNKSQCIQTLKEALTFKGISVVLGAIEDGVSANNKWPLYRWNPLEEDESSKFKLDSDEVKREMKQFLAADQHLTLVANEFMKLPKSFDQSLGAKYSNTEKKLKAQFSKLQSAVTKSESQQVVEEEDTTPTEEITLVILYGSDSGNAQSVAEKLAKKAVLSNKPTDEAPSSKFNKIAKIRCCEANEYSDIEQLIEFDFEDPALEDATVSDSQDDEKKEVSIFESESDSEDDSKAEVAATISSTAAAGGATSNSKLVVVFVLATAGQGEPTMNAKGLTDTLLGAKSPSNVLKNVNYAVFGLGDSHYWGKGSSDSEKYFCKIATDVDEKLQNLSGKRVCATQLGDDQDDDGYNAKLEVFEKDLWNSLKINVPTNVGSDAPEIIDDDIKTDSNFLRGTIDEGLVDNSTLKMLPEDTKLTKFHGIYQQDLRSVREELDAKQMERAYSFMIRIGIPGGVCGVGQLIQMMDICERYANKKLKLTTRQAFQIHGVIKKELKKTMQEINRGCMDTLAACGDVNRNVIANPHLHNSQANRIVNTLANKLSDHLKPRTSAYHEIWLDKKPLFSSKDDVEPIYGVTYLPRKFKIAIAVPPVNDVDVFSHCLGFIAIIGDNGALKGFNISIGGGMGTTHNNEATYPKLAPILGYVPCDQTNPENVENFIKIAEAIVILQRDNGERTNRKHARLKYTVEDLGLEFFQKNVARMSGVKLEPAQPFKFSRNADEYGWKRSPLTNKWSYTMFVENGYIVDKEDVKAKTGLRHIAEFLQKYIDESSDEKETELEKLTKTTGAPNFSMTANQHLIFGEIPDELKSQVQDLLNKYGLDNSRHSNLRIHSMACVALPTCGLAMAAAQTYLPDLITKLEKLLDKEGIADAEIVMRMTGCPNGCARPYMAEIAFVGKAPGQYNMYLGGGYGGNRLNKMYKEGIDEAEILDILGGLFSRYAKERKEHDGVFGRVERFGDWCIRAGVIEPTLDGKYFWKSGKENLIHDKLQVYW